MAAICITPKNWSSFQHYKNRAPAWIKLHRGLLDDYEFGCLPLASRALAPLLWLLASEHEEGKIEGSFEKLAYRLRTSANDFKEAVIPLIEAGFFVDASGVLAECKHDASLEIEEEKEIEEEVDKKETRARRAWLARPSADFEAWWEVYPHKVGKVAVAKAFHRVCPSQVSLAELLDGVRRYVANKPPDRAWCNPLTFLNQGRWADQPAFNDALAGSARLQPLTEKERRKEAWDDAIRQVGNFARGGGGSGSAAELVLAPPGRDRPPDVFGGRHRAADDLSAGSSGSSAERDAGPACEVHILAAHR